MVKTKINLKMKSKKIQIINLFFLISVTNTQILLAHNSLNGGCNNHCEKLFLQNNLKKLEKKFENFNNKNQIKDHYSCLNKSLCRG